MWRKYKIQYRQENTEHKKMLYGKKVQIVTKNIYNKKIILTKVRNMGRKKNKIQYKQKVQNIKNVIIKKMYNNVTKNNI